MRFPRFRILFQLRHALPCLLALCWLLSGSPLQACAENPLTAATGDGIKFPARFGEIVYQTQAAADSNIYIIANGHRSALSGAGTAKTLQAQIETFRIGEWLINQNQVELLLPEGFFGEMEGGIVNEKVPLDGQALQEALTDTSLFVNAELLLHENYGICLNQIEDRQLYRHTRERLRSNLEPEARFSPSLEHELAYLQKLRTASILQMAPEVIASAYQQGRIASPNAMLTIGVSHLKDIIAFLEAGQINLAGLHTTTSDFPAQDEELELLKRQVRVTVIVPRILIEQPI